MKQLKRIVSAMVCSAVLFATGCGATSDSSSEATRKVVEIPENAKLIALTFDDGPNTTTTTEVLDKLEKYDVVASFFVIGNNINESTAPVVQRAYDMGCEINNHSKTHSYMTSMTAEEIAEEIQVTSDKVTEITGEPPHFFRPPYIAVNDLMYETIDLPFICGSGSNDYDNTVSVEDRSGNVLKQISDGSIILLHDSAGNSKTVEALDLLIPALLEKGYTLVTVSQLFETRGITPAEGITYSHVNQTTAF